MIMIFIIQLSISLHVQTQCMRLVIFDTDSHVTSSTDTDSRVTYSKNMAIHKLCIAARLPH